AGNCPDTAVGATAACTLLVTVANGSAGTGNVVLSLIAISNEFAIDGARSTCGTILTPGNTCVLAVTFTPAVDGQRGGTLTITDNAPGSPHTVNLTGKGLGTPGISLSATTLSCPDTPVATTASCPTRLTITNPGTAQLTLSQVAITGSEFALDTLTNSTCGTTVAPGASCSLAINFTPSASGARTGAVRITDNGPGSPQTVTLSGNGTQAIVGLSPTAITCANTVVGVRVICSLTVTNSGNGGLNLSVAITAGGPEFVIDTSGGSSCGATLAAGATCTLSVGFTPSATGVRTGTLVMTDNAAGSPRTIALSGSGTQPAVSLSTTTIACADTQNGTTGGCQQLTLRNTGTSALTITPPLVTTTPFGADLPNSTCGATVAAGASCVIIVNFAPTTTFTGARTGTLTITDNAPGSPHIVNLTGMGVAAAPALGVSPVTVTCPAAAVSTTGTCPAVTLTNNGASAMTLTLPFTTAGDFTVNTGLSTCTTTLAPSATCTLTVSFTPVVTGARNGTATIAYTASAGSQTFIVTYRGTGT
ncbi:MAG: choice-of-anchor D domain-containing protein, partial [Chloroflexota bacterium]|nr:choice-of-anchor D domain-containing protein [Chloroflexota bacterium]